MNGVERDFDRLVAGWIVDDAPRRAPEHVLTGAMSRVAVARQRPVTLGRLRRTLAEMPATRRWLLVGLAALLAVGGIVAIGRVLIDDEVSPFSLVVLRVPERSQPGASVDRATVVAIDARGGERLLAEYNAERLGGRILPESAVVSRDGLLALAIDGHDRDAFTTVFDLGEPSAAGREVDDSGLLRWGPDGRLAIHTGEGPITILDPRTWTSGAVTFPGTVELNPGSARWARDGSGLVAFRDGGSRPAGIVTSDGRLIEGPAEVYHDGMGRREFRSDGTRIGCLGRPPACYRYDASASPLGEVVTSDWTGSPNTGRLLDFSVAVDDALLLVRERPGAGTEGPSIVHVGVDGEERLIASLGFSIDDGRTLEVGGWIVAIAPDDSRLVVGPPADTDDPGLRNAVDRSAAVVLSTGASMSVDGIVVGWLDRSALERPRPALPVGATTDPTIRGYWARTSAETGDAPVLNPATIAIERASLRLLRGSGQDHRFDVDVRDPDRVRVTQSTDALGCPVGSSASYGWRLSADRLVLTVSDDACAARAAAIAGTYERALPRPDSRPSSRLAPGQTVIAPDFAVPLRFSVAVPVDVQINDPGLIRLSDGPGANISLAMVDGSASEQSARPVEPGIEAAVALIEAAGDRATIRTRFQGETTISIDVGVARRDDVVVAGRPAVEVRLAVDRPDDASNLWIPLFDSNGSTVWIDADRSDPSVTLVELTGGRVLAVVAEGDPAWASGVIDSLEFVGP